MLCLHLQYIRVHPGGLHIFFCIYCFRYTYLVINCKQYLDNKKKKCV